MITGIHFRCCDFVLLCHYTYTITLCCRVAKLRDDLKLLDGNVGGLNNRLNSVDSAARERSSHLQAVIKSLQQWCREQYAHQSSMLVQCEEQLDNTKKVSAH